MPASTTEVVEERVMALLNQARIKRGLPAYRHDAILALAARNHCQSMARLNFFDHDSPVRAQREVNDRVRAAGGEDGNLGENLYWCKGLSEGKVGGSVLAEWLSSADHRETVLSNEYCRAGVGAYHRGKEFWVTLVCED